MSSSGRIPVLLLTALVFYACDQVCESAGIGNWSRGKFVLPDSINRSLLIAVYKTEEPLTVNVLIYDNEEKASARKITYFDEGKAISELLFASRKNVFHNLEKRIEYTITERSVISSAILSPASVSYNWAAGSTEIPGRAEYERVE